MRTARSGTSVGHARSNTECARAHGRSVSRPARRRRGDASLSRIRRSYETVWRHLAVDGLDLSIRKGEFVSLLGPSGCGKTTTLQMIAGFIEPTSGSVTLNGQDLLRVPPRARGLGIVFQILCAVSAHDGCRKRGVWGWRCADLPRRERREQGTGSTCACRPGALSRRGCRVNFRVASSNASPSPGRWSSGRSLLLLDEPLSNLDAKLREEMRDELRAIQRQTGATTITGNA